MKVTEEVSLQDVKCGIAWMRLNDAYKRARSAVSDQIMRSRTYGAFGTCSGTSILSPGTTAGRAAESGKTRTERRLTHA